MADDVRRPMMSGIGLFCRDFSKSDRPSDS